MVVQNDHYTDKVLAHQGLVFGVSVGLRISAPWQERLNLPYSEPIDNIYRHRPILRSVKFI